MAPVLVPKLKGFLAELDEIAPNRTKPDWWIGDQAHTQYPSGHNPDETGLPELRDPDTIDEVRGVDIRLPLNRQGLELWDVFDYLRKECAAGRITWIYYLIHKRKIASARSDWQWLDFGGYSPHTEHGHISGNLESDKAGYQKVGLSSLVEESGMELTDLISGCTNPADPTKTLDVPVAGVLRALWNRTHADVNEERFRARQERDAIKLLVQQVLTEVSDDPTVPVTIDNAAAELIAGKVSARVAIDTVTELQSRLEE